MDVAYTKLIELEPENEQWPDHQLKKLGEQVTWRKRFADTAEVLPDYEEAIRHYRAMIEIKLKHGEISEDLKLDLKQEVRELEEKADYDRSYKEIRKLIDDDKYAEALKQLKADFIQKGNYEHRNGEVARLLWGLVHAKLNQGEFPLAWENPLNRHADVVQAEQGQAQSGYARPIVVAILIMAACLIGSLLGTRAGLMVAPYAQNIPYLNALLFGVILIAILFSVGLYKFIEGMREGP